MKVEWYLPGLFWCCNWDIWLNLSCSSPPLALAVVGAGAPSAVPVAVPFPVPTLVVAAVGSALALALAVPVAVAFAVSGAFFGFL